MRLTSLVHLLLLGSMWGSSYLFIKVAVDGTSPLVLVSARLFFGAILLLAVVRVGRLGLPRELPVWGHLTIMAIIGNIIPWTLISWAGQYIDSGLAAVLNSTTPFFTILIAVVALRIEPLTIPRLIGLFLGFTGVFVLTGADIAELASASVQGQLAVLASSLCYGMAFVYARRFISGQPMVMAASQISLAFLLITPVALVFGNPLETDLSWTIVGSIIALGLLASGLAYILYYRLITDVGPTMASYTTYLIPVIGLFLGYLVLSEPITWRSVAGVVFILSGLAVATMLHRPGDTVDQTN